MNDSSINPVTVRKYGIRRGIFRQNNFRSGLPYIRNKVKLSGKINKKQIA